VLAVRAGDRADEPRVTPIVLARRPSHRRLARAEDEHRALVLDRDGRRERDVVGERRERRVLLLVDREQRALEERGAARRHLAPADRRERRRDEAEVGHELDEREAATAPSDAPDASPSGSASSHASPRASRARRAWGPRASSARRAWGPRASSARRAWGP